MIEITYVLIVVGVFWQDMKNCSHKENYSMNQSIMTGILWPVIVGSLLIKARDKE